MDTRQRDKDNEKEKEQAPGDRTPKVRGVAKDHRTWPADDPFGMWFGLVRLVTPISDFFYSVLHIFLVVDQTWTVVREKHREDRGHGKMYGEWLDPVNCVILVAYCATCELMLA
ncbi:hypothetical protein Bca52824_023470 [Brassica carinata]|uniref:Uncharacterized protein n=1 Tax=Brassica carinata TaxID=52824 RepID=A0A8X7VHV5_BRACI|nr:hypothetical protein Bca52824_023470 [Brassica carinata]